MQFERPSRSIQQVAALVLLTSLAVIGGESAAQSTPLAERVAPVPVLLPSPTGPHAVGKTNWHWPDPSRPDELTPQAEDVRELVVQAWYPAESAATPVEPGALPVYAPLSPSYEGVRDQAIPAARFAKLEFLAPVVILCPGRGAAAYSYSALAEDLASHGYAVFAFDAPHTGFVRYPDGRTVQPSDAFQIPISVLTGPYEHADAFFSQAEELGKGDFAFVVRRVEQLNFADPAGRFVGRLDLSRMGAIAHSMGGRACGAGVHRDARFKALVSADGVPPRTERFGGFDQAVLMLVSGDMPEMAMANFRSVIPKRRNDAYVLKLPNAGHNSIRDIPYLGANEPNDRIAAGEQLDLIRTVVRTFLHAYIRNTGKFTIEPAQKSQTLLEAHTVTIRRE